MGYAHLAAKLRLGSGRSTVTVTCKVRGDDAVF